MVNVYYTVITAQLPQPLRRLAEPRDTLLETSDPQCYKDFINELKELLPNCSLFLPGRLRSKEIIIYFIFDRRETVWCGLSIHCVIYYYL
jgi:hypothetical protein